MSIKGDCNIQGIFANGNVKIDRAEIKYAGYLMFNKI